MLNVIDAIEFSKDEIKSCINYCKNKTISNRKTLYDILKNYQIPVSWHKIDHIKSLDELELFEDDIDGYTNNDFKWDMEYLIQTGSCYGLNVYIFTLLQSIQKNK